MKRWPLSALVLAIALISAWAGFYVAQHSRQADIPTNTEAPSALLVAPLTGLDGSPLSLMHWPDKIRVVNFWATWCPPCREELPQLSALQAELGTGSIQFVGIAIDDAAKVKDFLSKSPLRYPTALASGATLGLTASLGNASQGLPFTLILDSHDKIVFSKLGLINVDDLRQQLQALNSGAH